MPALDPKTTVVIKIEDKEGKVTWSVLGLWSEINGILPEDLALGKRSPSTYYTDATRLGLDSAECLAYSAAQLEHYRLSQTPDAPVTAEWWMAYQTARAEEWNLASKISKTILDNFRTYVDQLILSAPPPWAEFITLAGMRIRIA
jgi:hypothetical protein